MGFCLRQDVHTCSCLRKPQIVPWVYRLSCAVSLSALAVGYVVEQGFIGYLFHFTGAVHFLSLGADMLYLNAPARPDDFIGFGFKFHHGRKICGDGIGGPHIDVDDTVEGPALLLDGAKAGQGVLAVGQG